VPRSPRPQSLDCSKRITHADELRIISQLQDGSEAMSFAEVLHALPLAAAQWEEDIRKAKAHWERAQELSNTPEFKQSVETLRDMFLPVVVDGVVYEKRWTFTQLFEAIKNELTAERFRDDPERQVFSVLKKETERAIESGTPLSDDDLITLRACRSLQLPPAARDIMEKLISHGERCKT
jgi:hypothetical protein